MLRKELLHQPHQRGGLLDAFASTTERPGERANVIAPGFALGKALLFTDNSDKDIRRRIRPSEKETNISRFQKALTEVDSYLTSAIEKATASGLKDTADLLETQQVLTKDSSFNKLVLSLISEHNASAQFAVESAVDFTCKMASGRSADCDRLLYDWNSIKDLLLQSLSGGISSSLSSLKEQVIVVHPNPSITDIQSADHKNILGWIVGSQTAASHVRIIFRDSQVPVVAVDNLSKIPQSATIAINSLHERVLIDPSREELEAFTSLRSAITSGDAGSSLTRIASVTACGTHIRLYGTLNSMSGLDKLENSGVTDIGLARTENLFFLGRKQSEWPNEDAQTKQLIQIARKFLPGKLTVRTFDMGADKWDERLGELPGGSDSKLGLKSVRLALSFPELFGSHLAAIIRAQSEVKNIYPMFPMISDLGELLECKFLLQEQAERLLAQRVINKIPPLKIGAMIENPAGVREIRKILTVADFISIGWSDLTQYTLAADRDVQAVSHSYMPHHPAVLRAIMEVTTAANEAGKPVSGCGEILSHRTYLPVALGLGLKMITVASDAVPKLNGKLQELYIEECQELVSKMIEAATPAQASEMLANFHKHNTN